MRVMPALLLLTARIALAGPTPSPALGEAEALLSQLGVRRGQWIGEWEVKKAREAGITSAQVEQLVRSLLTRCLASNADCPESSDRLRRSPGPDATAEAATSLIQLLE